VVEARVAERDGCSPGGGGGGEEGEEMRLATGGRGGRGWGRRWGVGLGGERLAEGGDGESALRGRERWRREVAMAERSGGTHGTELEQNRGGATVAVDWKDNSSTPRDRESIVSGWHAVAKI